MLLSRGKESTRNHNLQEKSIPDNFALLLLPPRLSRCEQSIFPSIVVVRSMFAGVVLPKLDESLPFLHDGL